MAEKKYGKDPTAMRSTNEKITDVRRLLEDPITRFRS